MGKEGKLNTAAINTEAFKIYQGWKSLDERQRLSEVKRKTGGTRPVKSLCILFVRGLIVIFMGNDYSFGYRNLKNNLYGRKC